MNNMRLDVVIPTYNRASLLQRALESVLAADRPNGMSVGVTVVDNRSTDDTRAIVESFVPRFGGGLHYIYEAIAGRSAALNTGISATRGDLVGMIDDDEEVDRGWLLTIAACVRGSGDRFHRGSCTCRAGAASVRSGSARRTARSSGGRSPGKRSSSSGPGVRRC